MTPAVLTSKDVAEMRQWMIDHYIITSEFSIGGEEMRRWCDALEAAWAERDELKASESKARALLVEARGYLKQMRSVLTERDRFREALGATGNAVAHALQAILAEERGEVGGIAEAKGILEDAWPLVEKSLTALSATKEEP